MTRDTLQQFLDKRVMVDAADAQGWTALMYAARDGHSHCVQYLLDAGADKDIKNEKGFKPFNFAVKNGHSEVIQLLENVSNSISLEIDEVTVAVDGSFTHAAPTAQRNSNSMQWPEAENKVPSICACIYTGCEEETKPTGPSQRIIEYIVKNTFIDEPLQIPEGAGLRCSSAPPSA